MVRPRHRSPRARQPGQRPVARRTDLCGLFERLRATYEAREQMPTPPPVPPTTADRHHRARPSGVPPTDPDAESGSDRELVGHGLEAALAASVRSRGDSRRPLRKKPTADAAPASGDAPVGQTPGRRPPGPDGGPRGVALGDDRPDEGPVLLAGEGLGMGVHGETGRTLAEGRCPRAQVEDESRRRPARCAGHREAQREAVGVDHGEIVQSAADRRRAAVRATTTGGRATPAAGRREGAGSESGAAVPSGACHDCGAVVEVAVRPPADVQGRDLDPDAGEVPRPSGAGRTGAGPSVASGYLPHAGRDVAVGVGLEVGVAHGGEALDENGRRVGRAPTRQGRRRAGTPAGRVGPARPWPDRSGPSRRRGSAAGADVRSGGDGDGRRCPGEAGVLSRDRALPDLDQPRRPRAGPGGGGAGRWVVHVGKNTGASPVITRRRGTGDGTVTR